MSARNKDEIVSRFMGITQCSNKHAREYLESANWNEQAAMDFFYDSGAVPVSEPVPPPKPRPTEKKTNTNVSKKPEPNQTNPYDDDDDLLQSALEESLQLKPAQKSPVAVPKRIDNKKSIISSKINTFDTVRNNKDDDDDDEEKGQAFYAGGSERSGQQILGPPKSRGDDNNVKKVFDAARKQGAREADDDDQSNSSTRSKNEKPFAGVGYSLGDNNTSSRTQDQPPSGATAAAASNAVEQLPIRFYSNGFTVGDGELRKFEDNKEFMEYIKRSEVPPELKNRTANGRQIEVRLEDHQSEEYKRVAPTFKPFGGAGHTVGLPRSDPSQFKSSSIATPVHTNSESPNASRLEQLAEKRLKTSSSSTTIRLRLPDLSTPISIKIDLNRTLNDVRRFLNENVPSLQSNTFEFMEPPLTKIKREDERQKISDTHFSNSTLAVRRTA